jgi:hypothetical protein
MILAATPVAGTRIRLALEVGKMRVRSLSTGLTWHGEPAALVFKVGPQSAAPPTRAGAASDRREASPATMHVGQLDLFVDSVPTNAIRFKLQVDLAAAAAASAEGQKPARIHNAFLCYAGQDRAEVLRRAQVLSLVGVESFVDVTSLSAGERWESELRRLIDRADAFVLFWSQAAKQSEWVEREWRYALRTRGLEFIIPVAIETPMPPPPPELAALHFSPSLAYLG